MQTDKMKYRETITLKDGTTVVGGQVVWLSSDNDPRSYPALVVDWTKSGGKIVVHRCNLKPLKNGKTRIKLCNPEVITNAVREMKFCGKAGAYRDSFGELSFSDED